MSHRTAVHQNGYRLSLEKVVKVLIVTLLFLGVFDSIRHYMILGSQVARVREVIILLCLLTIFQIDRYRIKLEFVRSPIFWYGAYSFLCFSVFVFSYLSVNSRWITEGNPFPSLYYKNLQFIMIIYIFYWAFSRFADEYRSFINLFINFSLLFIALNIVAYLVYIPIFESHRPYLGRISNGYPTMDGQVLSCALLLQLALFPGGAFNRFRSYILSLGIIIQITATGFISLVLIWSLFLFFPRKSSGANEGWRDRKGDWVALGILGGGVFSAFSVLIALYPELFTLSREIVFYRLNSITSLGSGNATGTIGVRIMQSTTAFNEFNTWPFILMGNGIGAHIESSYPYILRAFGVIGFVLHFMLFAQLLLFAFNKTGRLKFLTLGIIGLYLFTSVTLLPTYLLSLHVCFALVIGPLIALNASDNPGSLKLSIKFPSLFPLKQSAKHPDPLK